MAPRPGCAAWWRHSGSDCLGAGMLIKVAAGLTIVLVIGAGEALAAPPGVYLCTTQQRAGIGAIHLEQAPPPSSFKDDGKPVKFRMSIIDYAGFMPVAVKPQRIVELPYDGPGRDNAVWQDEFSVLHGGYIGAGTEFTAEKDQAFLRVGWRDGGKSLWFWHAGFEYPGGEDVNLSARFGECVKER